ncbi:hypothetical protein [Chryseobacterium populi]|uniref:Uncharacterized protein n=1 Tax=Chryseobacterium populi TaxID=1144316 RepID=J2TD62_9FLAO|nr:hypothetical protein [Chryseobacterium populi]EJL76122.1 hypothetical protein PMI13_00092 [Chryseobacterium populi]
MEENQDLQDLLGRIHQLVNYNLIGIDDLNVIQTFCNKEKERIERGNVMELIEKDKWKDYTVYAQQDTGKIHPESAIPMIWEYVDLNNLNDKYRKRLEISKSVADDIFLNVSEVDIFLGEINDGLIFMCKLNNGTSLEHYIVNNTLKKTPISQQEFDTYKTNYEGGLKRELDRYLQIDFANSLSTKKFTVGDVLYKELLRQFTVHSNIVISFYPAIHVLDYLRIINNGGVNVEVNYRRRLTFVMMLEYYSGASRIEIPGSGVYDRNGLCPPPDDSNC